MNPKIRYSVRKTYIQNSQHWGDAWYIWDNLKDERYSENYCTIPGFAEEDADRLNKRWQKEINKEAWKLNCKYFSYFNRITMFIQKKNLSGNDQDLIENQIKSIQKRRAKLLYDIYVEVCDYEDVGNRILHYNKLVFKENILRSHLDLNNLCEINSNQSFFDAKTELDYWMETSRKKDI